MKSAPTALKKFFVNIYKIFTSLFFDIRIVINKWRGIPYFIKTFFTYKSLSERNDKFNINLSALFPVLHERFEDAGTAEGHYFFQDLWAADYLYKSNIQEIVDVGSRIDGFIAHILPKIKVNYVDIRPIGKFHENFNFSQGSILNMPFKDNSIEHLSCLHVIEHIGLGRYGDIVDPSGHVKSVNELKRVIAFGGTLILGTPVGKERVNFNAHRVFHPKTIIDLFHPFELEELSLIDDNGKSIIKNPTLDQVASCEYGCGLFIFKNHAR